MAQQRILQLLRSNSVYASKEEAVTTVTAMQGADGEIRLARYNAGTQAEPDVKSLLCVYHKSPNLPDGTAAGWTFIEDASSNAGSTQALQAEVDRIEAAVGLTTTGTYQTDASDDTAQVMTGAQTGGTAPATVMDAVENVATYITTLDVDINKTASVDDSKIITGVEQINGQVDATAEELSSVKVASVSGSNAKIAAEDTLGTALGKLQAQIDAMDSTVTTAVNSGDVITSISETDGVVTANKANLTDVLMTGYTAVGNETNNIAATDSLADAFTKIENTIAQNTVSSNDKTIVIDTTGSTTDLAVNIDNTTIVKNATTGVLSADLEIVALNPTELAALQNDNVSEAYKLIYATDTNRNAIGTEIKIYKDSALKQVYLGTAQDTNSDATITKYAYELKAGETGTEYLTASEYVALSASDKEKYELMDGQSLNFLYYLADGTYSLVKVDVSKFLTESEYGDGLQVDQGEVSVKKDTTSGKVRIADTPSGVTPGADGDTGLVEVLTVSSNGVKVDNIQGAINYAVENATGDLSVSAQGDNYITAAVDQDNNKKINVSADVQSLTATAGTAGVYGNDGSQTTAPIHGTLSGTAESLADGADIATKVKTYVDGAIAIEAARSDAKNKVDIYALNGTADADGATTTATTPDADFKVLTKVVETAGAIVPASTEAVNLKKVAATGAAADVSYSDANSQMGTEQAPVANVQAAIEKLDSRIDALGTDALESVTSANAGIAVGTKANHTQQLTLTLDATTVGTGAEKTGADNALTITDAGLFLSNTWDCGTY